MVNGHKQFTWRKVAHRSNERLDCLVYALAALVHARVNLERLSGPLVEPEVKEQQSEVADKRPTWGVIHRAALPYDTNSWPKIPVGSVPQPQDKSSSPWGARSGEGEEASFIAGSGSLWLPHIIPDAFTLRLVINSSVASGLNTGR